MPDFDRVFDHLPSLLAAPLSLLLGVFFLQPGIVFLWLVGGWLISANLQREWPQILIQLTLLTLVFGAFRNPLVELIGQSHALIATPFELTYRFIQQGMRHLNRWISQARDAITTYGGQLPASDRPAPFLWELIGPQVYRTIAVILLLIEVFAGILGFAALWNISLVGLRLPLGIEVATGLLLGTVFLAFGLILFDIYDLAPNKLPWRMLTPERVRWLRRICLAGIAIAIVLAIAFFVWRPLQLRDEVPEPWTTIIEYVIWTSLAVLLVAADTLISWALIVALGTDYAISLLLLRVIAYLVGWVNRLMVNLLIRDAQFAVSVLDTVAAPSIAFRGWLATIPISRRWLPFEPVTRQPLRRIGARLEEPLFAAPGELPLAESVRARLE